MPTSTDKFIKGARRFSANLGAGGIADAVVTTFGLTDATGLPTDTPVAVVIDRVDLNGALTPDKEEVLVGVLSGTTVSSAIRGFEGTAQAHAAGAVVEVKLFNASWNRLIDGILVEHNADGTHGSTIVKTTGAQTLSGPKTLTAPIINVGSDAQGDVYYRNASGVLERLAPGTTGQFLKTMGAAANPVWADATPALVGATVKLTAVQSIPHNTWTYINWTAEDFDTNSLHDNVTNNDQVVIPTGQGGKYLVAFGVQIASNTTGLRSAKIHINGAEGPTYPAQRALSNVSGDNITLAASGVISLAAGDIVRVQVLQTSGGALNAGVDNTFLSVVKLG